MGSEGNFCSCIDTGELIFLDHSIKIVFKPSATDDIAANLFFLGRLFQLSFLNVFAVNTVAEKEPSKGIPSESGNPEANNKTGVENNTSKDVPSDYFRNKRKSLL